MNQGCPIALPRSGALEPRSLRNGLSQVPAALRPRIMRRHPVNVLDRQHRAAENRRLVCSLRDGRVAEPTTIGPYRVLEPLGRGGMGVVYRARHLNSERAIALKTVDIPASRWIDSIRREIQALTRIRHPGIVRIVDHGVHQGRPWYAMDLVEGESLRSFGQRL